MSKNKSDIIATVKCPHCNKNLDVIKEVNVLQEAVKAEKEITFRAVKSLQTKLEG